MRGVPREVRRRRPRLHCNGGFVRSAGRADASIARLASPTAPVETPREGAFPVLAVIAAWLPARRAAKSDILDAIATI